MVDKKGNFYTIQLICVNQRSILFRLNFHPAVELLAFRRDVGYQGHGLPVTHDLEPILIDEKIAQEVVLNGQSPV